jgi:1-acyl-sn-glycerol-3-phosphate acyltransferase
MDVPTWLCACTNHCAYWGKYEMVKYPVFGLIYRSAAILVDRRDPEHRAQSLRALRAAIARGISIFIFPEGTFNETGKPLKDFYDGAFRIAAETQTPIKPILFVDCLDRLHWRSIFP